GAGAGAHQSARKGPARQFLRRLRTYRRDGGRRRHRLAGAEARHPHRLHHPRHGRGGSYRNGEGAARHRALRPDGRCSTCGRRSRRGGLAMIVGGSESVLVMGITGKQGTFWADKMRGYGTRIIGGTNPKRAGETHLDLPVWASAQDAAKETKIDCAVMFIPPFGVKAAALDAIEAGIPKIVCLTDHVPVHDTMYFLAAARERGCQVIGPNTAGLVTTGECFVGFMPAFNERVFKAGEVGVISRSGSLGTLLCLNLVQAGLGISSFVGIGGDPIIGTTTRQALESLDRDPRTKAIALVGEIGGSME